MSTAQPQQRQGNATLNNILKTLMSFSQPGNDPIEKFAQTPIGSKVMILFKYFMRTFGVVLNFVALILLLLSGFFYYWFWMPLITPFPSFLFFINFPQTLWCGYCCLFNFLMASFIDPSSPPDYWLSQQRPNLEELKREDEELKGKKFTSVCKTCKEAKPARTHHCHACNKCVNRMDHHCPWINNCVGYQNHRYFLSFLAYFAFSCSYVGCMFIGMLIGILPCNLYLWNQYKSMYYLFGTLAIAFGVAMTGFGGWHFYLILTNQTTIEFQFNKMRQIQNWGRSSESINIYSHGIKENLKQIFGNKSYWEMLLPSVSDLPVADGIHWPVVNQYTKIQTPSESYEQVDNHWEGNSKNDKNESIETNAVIDIYPGTESKQNV